MYYEEAGRGRPLLLLHGGGSTAQTTFGALMPALSRSHHVIAPEQQAHGHTGDIERALSFEQIAGDMDALLEHLGLAQADVIGFSAGGVAATQLALRHPLRVRRLVLCSSFYARAGLPPTLWEGMAHATPANMPDVLREALFAAAPRREEVPRMFARQVGLMQSFRDIDESALRSIRAPALVMAGDADVMPVEHVASLARLLPHAELAVLPGSAHGTYLGALEGAKAGSHLPALTLAMLEEFLTRAD